MVEREYPVGLTVTIVCAFAVPAVTVPENAIELPPATGVPYKRLPLVSTPLTKDPAPPVED